MSPPRARSWRAPTTAALGILLAAATPLAFGEPGRPAPTEPDPVTLERAVVDDLADTLMGQEREPGFGLVRVNYAKSLVTVFWKGAPSPEVQRLAAEPPRGAVVDVVHADYSAADVISVGTMLLESSRLPGGLSTGVVGVMPNEDLSGLVVQLAIGSPMAAAGVTSSQNTLQELSGMPVRVETVTQPQDASRRNDSAPWQAGGAIADSAGNDFCTTGFAVIKSGEGRLLGARHCFSGNGDVVRDGVGTRIGEVKASQRDGDTVLIDPDASPATIGKTFGAAWNADPGDPGYEFSVGGATNPPDETEVCISGAISGIHCNVTVKNVFKIFECSDGLGTCVGFEATHNSGGVAGASGDSGGPVFKKNASGNVTARGIIATNGGTPLVCSSTSVPTTCFPRVNAVNIGWLLTHHIATIEIGP